jgi:2-iminoacetate synthase
LSTLTEVLTDYASPETRAAGKKLIAEEISRMPDDKLRARLQEYLCRIEQDGEHDLYF